MGDFHPKDHLTIIVQAEKEGEQNKEIKEGVLKISLCAHQRSLF